jgi:hypothetical protein
VKYLGVIFDKKLTWKLHTETRVSRAWCIFLTIYPILKSERLSVGAKLIIYKALIRSKFTYACPAWEFAADSYLLKSQWLQNRALRTIGNLPRDTPIRDLHRSFKIPYLYDYVKQLCREHVSVIRNHDVIIREARHRKYKWLKLGGGQAYDRSNSEPKMQTVRFADTFNYSQTMRFKPKTVTKYNYYHGLFITTSRRKIADIHFWNCDMYFCSLSDSMRVLRWMMKLSAFTCVLSNNSQHAECPEPETAFLHNHKHLPPSVPFLNTYQQMTITTIITLTARK